MLVFIIQLKMYVGVENPDSEHGSLPETVNVFRLEDHLNSKISELEQRMEYRDGDLRDRILRLEHRMDQFEHDMLGEISDLRDLLDEVKQDMGYLETELRDEIQAAGWRMGL